MNFLEIMGIIFLAVIALCALLFTAPVLMSIDEWMYARKERRNRTTTRRED